MKCQLRPRSCKLRRLFRGLLVPVLPDVGDPQRRQPPDVLRRMELGDDDQARRRRLPARGGHGGVDPAADGREVRLQLGQTGAFQRVRSVLRFSPGAVTG